MGGYKEIGVWRGSHAREARELCGRLSPVSLSVFSLVPDLLFDYSRVLEYAKIRTVLQSVSVLPICSKQALILLIADCFQNGNPQDPNCNGIHGVIAAYYHSIERVQLHGNISDLKGLLGPVYKGEGLPS